MSEPSLSEWQAQIGGLAVGPGTAYQWVSLDGIDELPSIRSGNSARAGAHGDFTGADFAEGRTVAVVLEVASGSGADGDYRAALAALRAATPPLEAIEFWINLPGLGVRCLDCKVQRRRFSVDQGYEAGVAIAEIQIRAADPFFYGSYITATAAFPTLVGGLEYDLYTDGAGTDLGYLDYGVASGTGRATLTNEGTAASWPQFEVSGPVDAAGFEIAVIGTGERLVYAGGVPAGSRLVLDSATGAVLLDGETDRSSLLTWRDWWPVPPGGSVEFAFIPLGPTSAGTVTASLRPAFW